MSRRRDPLDSGWFTAWLIFCAFVSVGLLVGGVVLVLHLLPHVVALIDRAGR